MTSKNPAKIAIPGRVFHPFRYSNGFNGSHDWFTIGYVKNERTSIRVFAERGKGWGVFIPKKQLPELIQSGKIVNQGGIERCSFRESWELFNA